MSQYRPWRFRVILFAAILLAVVQPLLSGNNDCYSFNLFLSVLVVAVSLSLLEESGHKRKAIAVGIGSFITIWLSTQLDGLSSQILLVAGLSLAALFFGFALYGILANILTKTVSHEALFAAVCGYLLLGIIWGLVYSSIDTILPGSFQGIPSTITTEDTLINNHGRLTYFSFVTLTTLGYGDVTPATPTTNTLAWIEAVTGQFYLAILVAGLVGMHVGRATRKKHS